MAIPTEQKSETGTFFHRELSTPLARRLCWSGDRPLLKRLKLSVFRLGTSRGRTSGWRPSSFSKSVGFEFVTEATFSWRLPVVARVGYAHGFDAGGEDQLYFFMGHWY